MATGFPVKANYATGDVLTAANMNDLSGTVNYLQYMPPRNPVLNSAFNVWQRGTSFTATGYAADRWYISVGNTGRTITRQTTSDTTNLPSIQYCMRVARDSGITTLQRISLGQSFETINSIPFAGKTVTLSFYARAGANFSAASNALVVNLLSGTGTDQNYLSSGYTGAALPINNQNATLTTTWQRFSFSGTVASTATELTVLYEFNPVGTAGAADYFEITGVQLELGSAANTYMPNQPTYQGELAACQRYLPAINYKWDQLGMAGSTSTTYIYYQFVVQPRVAPTGLTYSALSDFRIYNKTGTVGTPTAITFNAAGLQTASITFNTTAGSPTLVQGDLAEAYNNAGSGLILFTGCEL